ncbi:MAG: molecular chaperone HtpG [Pseudomonadota bacterium]
MSSDNQKQTFGFQAEVKQLLQLMIHSLYSNKEIFLRELTSNASDALDKLRFEAIAQPDLLGDDPELSISIEADKDAGTVTITDNGIGMSRDEVAENLGTIARSGTAEFVSKLSGDAKSDAQLIGQFGVGFYASFIVAEEVTVETRRAGHSADEAVRWVSRGEGEYTLEPITRDARGTAITLKLKADETEFAEPYRLTSLIKKYSDHIAFPVKLIKDGEDEQEIETINSATALWTRSRSEVSDDEYKAFYKHLTHDFEEPLDWSHNRVEGKREYTSLIYLPARAPFDLWNREAPRGLKLYVQRVFIMDDAEQFLPLYLRFVRGVVDSSDLPLNVSRELLQSHPTLDAMRSALTKRVLTMLKKMANDEPEQYQRFWKEFGEVMKEGLAEDFANRETLMELLRVATTNDDSDAPTQSLADYCERMVDGQDQIYYLTAESLAAAKSSPHLEVFRKRGIEVVLLTDRLDEWMIGHLTEFDGKALQDIRRDGLKLPGESVDEDVESEQAEDKDEPALVAKLKERLSAQVSAVRASDRLVESPACLVVAADDIGVQMRRMLEAAGQEVPDTKPVLEVNLEHPLLSRLEAEQDDARFDDLAMVIFGQAEIAQGGLPEDPGAYVARLNRLLVELAA